MPALSITVFESDGKYYATIHEPSQKNLPPGAKEIFSKTRDVVAGQLYKLRQVAKEEVRERNILKAVVGLCRAEHWKK